MIAKCKSTSLLFKLLDKQLWLKLPNIHVTDWGLGQLLTGGGYTMGSVAVIGTCGGDSGVSNCILKAAGIVGGGGTAVCIQLSKLFNIEF